MKKTFLAILAGVLLGVVLMVGIFTVLSMKPSKEDMYAQVNSDHVEQVKDESFYHEEDVEYEIDNALDDLENAIIESETEDEVVIETQQTIEGLNPYYIKVNRQANCVTVYTYDETGNYTVPVKAMICSVGLNNKTPLGVSKISDKYTWRLLFGDVYGHYAVRFNGHIMFHSVPYMKPSNSTLKEGQFNLLGEPASLGCVRLCVADVKWIYDNCAKGTIVEVYDSSDPGPLGKPNMYQIPEDSPLRGWDPTDPDPANPWHQGTVELYGVEDKVIGIGDTEGVLEGVTAVDRDGTELEISVSGDLDIHAIGNYEVTYSATGVMGDEVSKTALITVLGEAQN